MPTPTKIYVFKTKRGAFWADYTVPENVHKKSVIRSFDLADPQAVIDAPGSVVPDRVAGLARRVRDERSKRGVTEIPVIPEKLVSLSFWQRLVWFVTGKV